MIRSENNTYFITAIDTNVGKTVVSAILCKALKAAYWKPVQSGDLDNSDTLTIKKLLGSDWNCYPETFRLTSALSPHRSAEIDGVNINLECFKLPEVENLVVEGAGGLLVPLNYSGLNVIDLICRFDLPVVLVIRNYLGSINHTCLSLEVLKNRGIKVVGLVVVGERNDASEKIICDNYKVSILLHVPITHTPDSLFVAKQAELLIKNLNEQSGA